MSRFKSSILAVLAFAAAAMLVPAAAFAAQSHRAAPTPPNSEVYGSLLSFDATSAVIQTKIAHVKVRLEPIVAYVSYDQAAAVAGLKVGDQVDATGTFIDGTLHVDRLRYDTTAFPVRRVFKFEGRFVATPATTPATLTIQLKKGQNITFNLDANTKYYQNGKRLSGPPTFEARERINVWAQQYSDQAWLAKIVNAIDPKLH